MSRFTRRMLLGSMLAAPVTVLSATSAIAADTNATPPEPPIFSLPTDLSGGYTAADRPAIFYSPHSDDETLSMGLDIANHLLAGRNVLLVLMTQGGSGWLIDTFNGSRYDGTQKVMHNPEREHYADNPITSETVRSARLKEFTSAAGALNTVPGNLRVVATGFPEGITVAAAKDVMKTLHNLFPGASHKTLTYTDSSADHANCGRALLELRDEKVLSDARWYIPYYRLQLAQNARLSITRILANSSEVTTAVKLAASSYKAWNPAAGSYAYGWHSVPDLITATEANPQGYLHR